MLGISNTLAEMSDLIYTSGGRSLAFRLLKSFGREVASKGSVSVLARAQPEAIQ
jgi:hypothetical protein